MSPFGVDPFKNAAARNSLLSSQLDEASRGSLGRIIGSFLSEPTGVHPRAYYHGPGIPLGKLAPYLKNILR